MAGKTILRATGLCKSFPGVKALDNVSFELKTGEVHVLVGENGAGKSTLVKILTGVYEKDAGLIEIEGEQIEIRSPAHASRLGVAIVHQEFNLQPYLTVGQNIFLGREPVRKNGLIDWPLLYKEVERLCTEFGISLDPYQIVNHLSIGEQQLVEIAKALSTKAKLIIMDEPSAVLTQNELRVLFKLIHRLKAEGVTIVYISHRLEEVWSIGDRLTVMRDGRVVLTVPLAKITMEEVVRAMIGRELPRMEKPKRPADQQMLKVALEAPPVLKSVSFDLQKGHILGIFGLIGSGRTTILDALFGIEKKASATIVYQGQNVEINSPRIAKNLGITYVTSDRKQEGLVSLMSVKDNICLARPSTKALGFIDHEAQRGIVRRFVDRFAIRCSDTNAIVETLSGGNQQKVVLSKWLNCSPNLLLLDEPTRGVDIGAKQEIRGLIRELVDEGISVIWSSSELPEILEVSDELLVMYRGQIVLRAKPEEVEHDHVLLYAMNGGKKSNGNADINGDN